METDNSICSFKAPALWQEALKDPKAFTQEQGQAILEELILAIDLHQCEILYDVVNHLFQKGTFDTLAISTDIRPSRGLKKKKVTFREDEDIICVDDKKQAIIPNFGIRTKPGIDVPYPYLLAQQNQVYAYTFEVLNKSIVRIEIDTIGQVKCDIYINEAYIPKTYHKKGMIELHKTLDKGVHQLTIKCEHEAIIKCIRFKA